MSRRARPGAFAATLVGAVGVAAFVGPVRPAGAVAPVRTAWWNLSPAGFFPTQTSPGQLAVSEGGTGAMALAAVAYRAGSVPSSAATLTLAVDGNGSFGPAQVQACPVKQASTGWKEGGDQTGSPPAYDCSRSVTGKLASSGDSVAFVLGAAQAEPDGSFNLVVLPAAGALPFELVIDPPGSSSLAARPQSPAAPGAQAPAGGGGAAPAPASSPGPDTAPAPGPSASPPPSGQGLPLTASDTGALPAAPAPAAVSAPAVPSSSPPGVSTTGGAAAQPPPPVPGAPAAGRSSVTGKILGFAALLIVLILYSEGFGVLGGRIRPLSSRSGRRQAGERTLSA